MHEGRQLVHTILPITVDKLFNLLFSESKFLVDFHIARKTTDFTGGEWTVNEDGQKCRIVSLCIALRQPVGPKSSHVTENQSLRDCSKEDQLYSVDITSTNAGIPYADSFYVTMHYCLSRTVDDHTVFSVHAQIKYKKSVWGVVKGFIEKNTWAGLEEFYSALLRALQNDYCIPPAKAKARSRKNRGSLQRGVQPPGEEPPRSKANPITSIKNIPPSKLPSIEPPKKKNKYEKMSLFVIFLLLTLFIVNVILYFKLSALEVKTNENERIPNFAALT